MMQCGTGAGWYLIAADNPALRQTMMLSDFSGKSEEFLCELRSRLRAEDRNAISLREEFNSFDDFVLSLELFITKKYTHSKCLKRRMITIRTTRRG
jgi:hypothetical protein